MAEKIEEKTGCPVFKLLGVHMIVCFRPFFLRLLKRKKKQKHLEFNVKVARAKPEHLFHICTVTTLPSPTHFEPPLHWYEGVFHSIREATLLFCNLVKCPRRPLNKELRDRCIVPAQSELAHDGVFTFILFLVFSGHALIKWKLSLLLKTLH